MDRRALVLLGLLGACRIDGAGDDDAPKDDDTEDTDPSVDTDPSTDSVPAPLTDWTPADGTRLLRVHLTHEDTTERVFSHFHDTELDAPCRFQRAEDGRMRCLPLGDELILSEGPDCTTLGAYLHRSCREHRYVTEPIYGCFEGEPLLVRSRVWEVTVDPTVTQASDPGRCDLHDLRDDVVFAPLGDDPLPPATFVAAAPHVVETGASVDMVVLLADDGARMPLGFWDPARGGPCRPTQFLSEDEGVVRCAPLVDTAAAPHLVNGSAWGLPTGFSTSACETLGAARMPTCGAEDGLTDPVAEVPLLAATRAVVRVRSLYDVGAELVAAWHVTSEWDDDAYRDVSVCRELGSAEMVPYATWRDLVAPIAPEDLPRLSEGPVTSGGVSAWAWHLDDGRVAMPTDPLRFAAADGVPCRAVRDGLEGPAHCLPDGVGQVSTSAYFLNAQCDGPTVRVSTRAAAVGSVALSEAVGGTCFGADGPWGLRDADPVVVDEVLPTDTVYWEGGFWLPQCLAYAPVPFLGTPPEVVLDEHRPAWTVLRTRDDPRTVSDFPRLGLE